MKKLKIKKEKINLILIMLMFLVFFFTFQNYTEAKVENEDQILEKVQKVNEDNPESTVYLITDEYISNVAPNTKIETFKNNIEEEIKVYEDANKEKEVISGIVKTGMILEYTKNNKIYEINVLGDTNKDGILNQIDLTKIIRDVVNSKELGKEKLVEDINRDNKVDEKDIEKIIDYIVYNKISFDKFNKVEKPLIEVSGEKDEDNRYHGEVSVKIIEQNPKDKTSKTEYKVIGSIEKAYKEIDGEDELIIDSDGVFRIIAYTYGIDGNKSKGESILIIREEGKIVTYKEITYEMDTNGEYKEVIENKTGRVGETVSMSVNSKEGFTYDENKSTPTATIKADGNTILKIYYNRNKYKLTTDLGIGIEEVEGGNTYYYGSTVEIDAVVKNGYLWSKWTSNSNKVLDITEKKTSIIMPSENITLTANATIVSYSITYELNGGEVAESKINPTTYTIESENIILNNPTKLGYTFIGWTGSNGEVPQMAVIIEKGSSGDKTYIANWKLSADEDTEYTITYDLAGGNIETENPTKYTINTSDIILNNPTKLGYTFIGWTGSNGDVPQTIVTISKGSAGDKIYIANWSINSYKLTVNPSGGTWNGKTTESEFERNYLETIQISAPTKSGFKFVAWTLEGAGSITANEPVDTSEQIYTFGAGDGILRAVWQPTIYRLFVIVGEGGDVSNYTSEKNYEENVNLVATAKTGYNFDGWYEGENKISSDTNYTFTMPDRDYTLIAKFEAIEYSITYNLDGGSLDVENPTKYTIETSDITLNNPSKSGYTFIGWTGSNGEIASDKVIIEKGSTGNKVYKANWRENTPDDKEYKVETYQMNLLGNYEKIAEKTKIGKIGDTVTEVPGAKTGFTYNDSLSVLSGIVSENESTVLKIYYDRNKYKFNKIIGNGGTVSESKSEMYYEESVNLIATANNGYLFDGWYEGENRISSDVNVTFTMPANDYTIIAKFTPIEYRITYVLDGGSIGDGKINPETYTIETESFTLNNPTKVGYTFEGWVDNNGGTAQTTVTISKGSSGDKTYTAKWKINKYELTIDPNGGTWGDVTTNSKFEQDYGTVKSIVVPTRIGYTFTGWTLNGTGSITNKEPITTTVQEFTFGAGNATITAQWEVVSSTVSIDPNGGTWKGISNTSTITGKFGTDTKIEPPIRTGYTFTGWSLNGSGSITKTLPLDTTSQTYIFGEKDAILTANWEKTEYKLTVKYYLENINDNNYTLSTTNTTTYDIEYNQEITLADYKKSITNYTYDFASLTCEENENSGIDKVLTTTITGDTTIGLYYKRNRYGLTLIAGNNVKAVSGGGTYKVGQTVLISATLESKSGYIVTFSGWSGDLSLASQSSSLTMPAKNIQLTANATSTKNTYTVTYYDGSGNALKKEVTAGGYFNETVYKPSDNTGVWKGNNYTRTYTFVGWALSTTNRSNVKSVQINQDTTLYPVFLTQQISEEGTVSYSDVTVSSGGIERKYDRYVYENGRCTSAETNMDDGVNNAWIVDTESTFQCFQLYESGDSVNGVLIRKYVIVYPLETVEKVFK